MHRPNRRGTAAIEFAIVAPVIFFLMLSIMIGSQGVFRYHQVAALARDASRWAAVRGSDYEKETGNSAATAEDIYNSVILPNALTLKPEHLSYQVNWNRSNIPVEVIDDVQNPVGNTVSVTISYEWFPEMLLVGPFTLSSTSTHQMYY